MDKIKLTQYSHGAGCGCKISPEILDKILRGSIAMPDNNNLIVGNHSKDDAAVYDMGSGKALISTTDFFMPIVDDPFQFGRIASANAISDVYAMGGKPLLAIAILGWPINIIQPEIASMVLEGAKSICIEAGIPLAGGHSIDSPEPIFGLAVNGIVDKKNIKKNNGAKEGDLLFLTKKIGVGILTTAEKRGIIKLEDQEIAALQMMQLNKVGEQFGEIALVNAMTDVTGFGLFGHLCEMTDGNEISAVIKKDKIKLLGNNIRYYLDQKTIPGGTQRNWSSYGHKIKIDDAINFNETKALFADPQTSGGLLISIDPSIANTVQEILKSNGLVEFIEPIGVITKKEKFDVIVN